MMLLGVVGVAVLTGGELLGAGFRSSVGLAFGLDPLSGFFLAVLALTAVPTLIFARDYLPGSHGARALGALTAAFLLALVGVLAARDVIGFLGFWELMTLVPAAAILVSRRDGEVRSAVYAYLAITHLGGAGVWIALLVLCTSRRDRRPRRARGRRQRRPDARSDRGAGRLRDQGRVHPAALLAAACASGCAGAPVGADVGDDDQGRAVRADPGRVPVARRDAAVARARAPGDRPDLLARRRPVGARPA